MVKTFLLETGWTQVGAPPAHCLLRGGVSTSELAGRADIHTGTAQSADLGAEIEWSAEVPLLSPALKADGLGHHLFFAHPNASSAEDAVLVFLFETLCMDVIS